MKKILSLLSILLLIHSTCFAAISSRCQWELRSTGTTTGGGGFVTGASGTDYSQQDAVQFALTGCTTSGASAIFKNANATPAMIGNICRTVSGTNFVNNQWFEILSADPDSTNITVDRNIATGVGANGVINVGGAFSLGTSLDDDFFEQISDGNTIWMKYGTFTLGESVSISNAGTTTDIINIIGYKTTRGDNPTDDNRPIIDCASSTGMTITNYWYLYNLDFIGTSTGLFNCATSGSNIVYNCRFNNSSNTTSRQAAGIGSYRQILLKCEFKCAYGYAISDAGGSTVEYSSIHNSFLGYRFNTSGAVISNDSFYENSADISTVSSTNFSIDVINNTFYGKESPEGTSMSFDTGEWFIYNNIFYGHNTALSSRVTYDSTIVQHNLFFNNITDAVNVNINSDDTNTFNKNPRFIGATDHDFTLQYDSPCIGTGLSIGTTENVNGVYPLNIGVDQDNSMGTGDHSSGYVD